MQQQEQVKRSRPHFMKTLILEIKALSQELPHAEPCSPIFSFLTSDAIWKDRPFCLTLIQVVCKLDLNAKPR